MPPCHARLRCALMPPTAYAAEMPYLRRRGWFSLSMDYVRVDSGADAAPHSVRQKQRTGRLSAYARNGSSTLTAARHRYVRRHAFESRQQFSRAAADTLFSVDTIFITC